MRPDSFSEANYSFSEANYTLIPVSRFVGAGGMRGWYSVLEPVWLNVSGRIWL